MWRILRAEISYDRSRLVLVFVFCLACLITIWFGVKWERNVPPMTVLILFVSSLVAVYAGEQGRIIYKRDRMHVALPVSLWKTGFSHLFYPAFVWGTALVLYEVSYFVLEFISSTTRVKLSFSQILVSSGLFFMVNAFVLLTRDLGKIVTKKSHRVLIYMIGYFLFIAALLPFYILTNFLGAFGENTRLQSFLSALSESPTGFILLGVCLSITSLFVFVKRKSYIQS